MDWLLSVVRYRTPQQSSFISDRISNQKPFKKLESLRTLQEHFLLNTQLTEHKMRIPFPSFILFKEGLKVFSYRTALSVYFCLKAIHVSSNRTIQRWNRCVTFIAYLLKHVSFAHCFISTCGSSKTLITAAKPNMLPKLVFSSDANEIILCSRDPLSSTLPVQPNSTMASMMDMVQNLRKGTVFNQSCLFSAKSILKCYACIRSKMLFSNECVNTPFQQVLSEMVAMWKGEQLHS